MENLKVKHKVNLGLGANVMLLAGAGYVAVSGLTKLARCAKEIEAANGIKKANEAIGHLNEIFKKKNEEEPVEEETTE